MRSVSRSIHDTRGVLRRLLAADYADYRLQKALIDEVRENIRRQRRIKQRLRQQRGRDDRPPLPIVDPAAAPVLVEDEGPYVHHAATEADVREILRRVPPGSLDGLGPIRLCLGLPRSREEDDEPDPFTGRPGFELLPGVYAADVGGWYHTSDCSVHLHAYVHEAGASGPFGIYLKLSALSTLVHELSHHYDYAFRSRGDRWRMDPGEQAESYAEGREAELVESCVVPYLRERYADECAALHRWQTRHAGLALPLEDLADAEPGAALLALARALAAGEPPLRARAEYAHSLARFDRTDEASQIISGIFSEQPGHPEALATHALLAYNSDQYDVAEQSCRSALAAAPTNQYAEVLLAQVLRDRARWEELAEMTTRALARPDSPSRAWTLLGLRARARVELLQYDAAKDIVALRRSGDDDAQQEADVLEALRLCRNGRWDLALEAAEPLVRATDLGREHQAEARAVLLECALRLGLNNRVTPLDDADLASLRRHGHGIWVDRLLADLAARAEKHP
jgi:hypothetical protein